jgi:hypothetical protein
MKVIVTCKTLFVWNDEYKKYYQDNRKFGQISKLETEEYNSASLLL